MSVLSHSGRHAHSRDLAQPSWLRTVRDQFALLPSDDAEVRHGPRSHVVAFVTGTVAVSGVLIGIAWVLSSATVPSSSPDEPAVPIRLDERVAQLANPAQPGGGGGGGGATVRTPDGRVVTLGQATPQFFFFAPSGPVPVRTVPSVPGSGLSVSFVAADVVNAGTASGSASGGAGSSGWQTPGGGGGTTPGGGPVPTPDPTVTHDPDPTPDPPVTTDPTPDPPATTDPTPDPPATTDPTPDPPATTEPDPSPDPPATTEPAPDPPTADPEPVDPSPSQAPPSSDEPPVAS